MKVLAPLEATLPNAEVHAHLTALIARYTSHPDFNDTSHARLARLYRVTRDVVAYFEASETGLPQASVPSGQWTTEINAALEGKIGKLLAELMALPTVTGSGKEKLTKAEAMMIVNVVPVEEPVLECVVEEIEERYGEEAREEMLILCREFAGVKDGDDGDDPMEA